MSVIASLPQEYGYVLITAASTFFVGFWHGIRVSAFRKPAGIVYPQAYADKSDMSAATPEQKKKMYLFNCAQRAHGNYLENETSFIASLLVAGLKFPVAASVLGAGWIVSRILYAVGYTRADKEAGKGRLIGLPFWLFQLGLYGLVMYSGIKML
ncbi:hypothetical protein MBLNU13_g07820t1 [Cladosporium sp. NU13]